MEVTSKHLLNSAQTILKNRNQDNSTRRQSATNSPVASNNRTEDQSNGINSHVLRIQSRLNDAQRSYSLEQARLSFVEQGGGDPVSSQYDGQSLFPDFPYGKSLDEYRQEADSRIGELARTLKGLQVEMENVLALNFETQPNISINADTLAAVRGLSSLNPERVAKLTS